MSSYAEVVEGVRAALAAYTQALDDGRTDDVVATFCADGGFDLPGMGSFAGQDALRSAFAGWKPRRPQRHLVLNTLVTEWDEQTAHAVSDVVLIILGDHGWGIQLVGRYTDTLRHDDGGWRFSHRTATFVSDHPPPKGTA